MCVWLRGVLPGGIHCPASTKEEVRLIQSLMCGDNIVVLGSPGLTAARIYCAEDSFLSDIRSIRHSYK